MFLNKDVDRDVLTSVLEIINVSIKRDQCRVSADVGNGEKRRRLTSVNGSRINRSKRCGNEPSSVKKMKKRFR
jgi:hypothetical protein